MDWTITTRNDDPRRVSEISCYALAAHRQEFLAASGAESRDIHGRHGRHGVADGRADGGDGRARIAVRSEEHTSELQSH